MRAMIVRLRSAGSVTAANESMAVTSIGRSTPREVERQLVHVVGLGVLGQLDHLVLEREDHPWVDLE